ncbi:MAG: hypothetical protein WC775_04245 [Patescibacteria group bacterium]|jgi:hypothetical protein
MELWQTIVVGLYSVLSLMVFVLGIYQSIKKRNPYKETLLLSWMGIFVWGDALTIGFFWFLASLISLYINDWLLFLLIVSVFWIVRSLGETIYWMNQQFVKDNKYCEKVMGYGLLKSNAIFFVYQTYWQCLTVVSIVTTIYLTHLWLLHTS